VWPYGRQFIQGFWVWNVRGGDSLGDLGVDGGGGALLKLNFKKGRMRNGFVCLRIKTNDGVL